MTRERTLQFKGNVVFLTATASGEYYVVASAKRSLVTVKRCANHKTTICLTCAKWEGVSDTGQVNEIGCDHTNLVEYAVARGVALKAGDNSSLSAALHSMPNYVETEELEPGGLPE